MTLLATAFFSFAVAQASASLVDPWCFDQGVRGCNEDENCKAFSIENHTVEFHGCLNYGKVHDNERLYTKQTSLPHRRRYSYDMLSGVKVDEKHCRLHPSNGSMSCPPPAIFPYEVIGSIDVGTLESSIFFWKGTHYVLENIMCGYIDHFGAYDHRFRGHSYARIRELSSGLCVANISETIGYSFISAFTDEEHDTMWLVGTAGDRCHTQCANGVQVFWSKDLESWHSFRALGMHTCNVQIAKVDNEKLSSTSVTVSTLPPHKYVMILEPYRFMLNNNADGNLSYGWFAAPNASVPAAPVGGPSIQFEDGYYYLITGGGPVFLTRSHDLHSWSKPVLMVRPSAADALIAPYADFPEQASRKGFDEMRKNPELWDWNSNDADVCCHSSKSKGAWLVWGASTQGHLPIKPVTMKSASANVIGFSANLTLAELLASFFPADELLVI